MIRECCICGMKFATKVSNKITCSKKCSEKRRRQYMDELNAKAREATRVRLGTKICATCGKEFAPNHPAKVCCSPGCQKERDRELTRLYWNKKNSPVENKPVDKAQAIIDINTKAKAMGMTYGQYVAYVEGKKLWNGSQRKTDK